MTYYEKLRFMRYKQNEFCYLRNDLSYTCTIILLVSVLIRRLANNNKYIFTANEKLRLAMEFQFEGTSRMHNIPNYLIVECDNTML